jgi:cellulose synthase/poly-beta-1,6-N-acetylglucosamine synthase-like glycosyltransferase
MPSENEMFYGIIQRGLDRWNAAFFCGSAALLRREALATNNGFSGKSITEDCETAIELHSRGWNSIYIDKPLVAGLQPVTFASFIGQRTRWAQGMMQILLFSFPLFKSGLSLPQRLCYLSSTLFWLFPLPRMIFLFAPFFYLFLDLQIFTASAGEFAAYTLTYVLPVRQCALAVDFRALRIYPVGAPLGRALFSREKSLQTELQGHRQGRERRNRAPLGTRPALLPHLPAPDPRRRYDHLQDRRRALSGRGDHGRRRLEHL